MPIRGAVTCIMLIAMLLPLHGREPLIVVTEDLPPLQIVTQGRLTGGLAYHKVKRIIEQAKLDVNWLAAPWSRVYNMALSEPNVLLFSVVRTPQREDKFHWIGQLFLMDLYLMSLESANLTVTTLEQAKSLMVGAKRADVVFDYLESVGFNTGKNMIVVRNTADTYNVLLKGRVDLVPANKTMINAYCAEANCSLSDFRFNIPLPDMQQDFYLAASKGTDPEIIKALQQAFRLLEPELNTISVNE